MGGGSFIDGITANFEALSIRPLTGFWFLILNPFELERTTGPALFEYNSLKKDGILLGQ